LDDLLIHSDKEGNAAGEHELDSGFEMVNHSSMEPSTLVLDQNGSNVMDNGNELEICIAFCNSVCKFALLILSRFLYMFVVVYMCSFGCQAKAYKLIYPAWQELKIFVFTVMKVTLLVILIVLLRPNSLVHIYLLE